MLTGPEADLSRLDEGLRDLTRLRDLDWRIHRFDGISQLKDDLMVDWIERMFHVSSRQSALTHLDEFVASRSQVIPQLAGGDDVSWNMHTGIVEDLTCERDAIV